MFSKSFVCMFFHHISDSLPQFVFCFGKVFYLHISMSVGSSIKSSMLLISTFINCSNVLTIVTSMNIRYKIKGLRMEACWQKKGIESECLRCVEIENFLFNKLHTQRVKNFEKIVVV